MVLDDHQVTHVKTKVCASGSVGYEQVLDSHHQHHADGENHHVHAVALVVVDTSLHCKDLLSGKGAGDVIAFVPRCGGHREAGEFLVGYSDGVFNGIGKRTKAASKDNSYFRSKTSKPLLQYGDNILYLLNFGVHILWLDLLQNFPGLMENLCLVGNGAVSHDPFSACHHIRNHITVSGVHKVCKGGGGGDESSAAKVYER